ncbi:MAG: hypothetical protein EPO24_12065 [Bacteroidetes bacterium]|nr:MAG: hypothetical protein EPO24_12065 [Bacteroidota bacterium]
MNIKTKYRWVSLGLAAVFCLYTVGLPIIISACPMMSANNGRGSCCAELPTDGLKISSTKDTSCCKTTIAAKPNTSEFVASNLNLLHFNSIIFFAISTVVVNLQSTTTEYTSYVNSSPPLWSVMDIPVVTSSLLI